MYEMAKHFVQTLDTIRLWTIIVVQHLSNARDVPITVRWKERCSNVRVVTPTGM